MILKNRKAVELSVTFIVVLIISLVVFIGGLSLGYKFMHKATEMKADLDRETEAEIERLLTEGTDRVAIPISKKTIKRDQSDVFGLGILNIESGPFFSVKIEFDSAYKTADKSEISAEKSFIDGAWIFGELGPYNINNNEHKSIPILVKVNGALNSGGDPTEKGIYIFNVEVCQGVDETSSSCTGSNLYSPVLKFYVQVP